MLLYGIKLICALQILQTVSAVQKHPTRAQLDDIKTMQQQTLNDNVNVYGNFVGRKQRWQRGKRNYVPASMINHTNSSKLLNRQSVDESELSAISQTKSNFSKIKLNLKINPINSSHNGVTERNVQSIYNKSMFGAYNVFLDNEVLHKTLRDVQNREHNNPFVEGLSDSEQNANSKVATVFVEQRSQVKLKCDVDIDVRTSIWSKNGQMVQTAEHSTIVNSETRFIKDARGNMIINSVRLEDDGYWQCEVEDFQRNIKTGRLIKLIVLNPPQPPYLLIDVQRLNASNFFLQVKENTELNLSCVSEGGNPKPLLKWELLLSPTLEHNSQKVTSDSLEIIKEESTIYNINNGAKAEAKLPVIFRAHHNARVLCVMEHPSLKVQQNASILLDVQYSPSFAITRVPGFGIPIHEGMDVSLKCDVDANPPSKVVWLMTNGQPPNAQMENGYMNFTHIRMEHSGWYKCTSTYLNVLYSSIEYFLSVRYEKEDVTTGPIEQELSLLTTSSSITTVGAEVEHYPQMKVNQIDVELGGSVTLQCPHDSLGCWSYLDPVNSRLKGLGAGLSTPTGHFALSDILYQDAGIYKCIGQLGNTKKKVEVLQTVSVGVKGPPTVTSRNSTPTAYAGAPLHLSVEFCANPPAHAARWLHGDRVYTPGNQYGTNVLTYGVIDLPIPYCKEARLTIVHMHDRVPRTFHFIVSSSSGVTESTININYTLKNRHLAKSSSDAEELEKPDEVLTSKKKDTVSSDANTTMIFAHYWIILIILNLCFKCSHTKFVPKFFYIM